LCPFGFRFSQTSISYFLFLYNPIRKNISKIAKKNLAACRRKDSDGILIVWTAKDAGVALAEINRDFHVDALRDI
jgi:hypothetical protein